MEEEEIVENVMAVVEAAVQKVPKKWANVRALHLKAVDSVALPIYQIVLELGTKIEVPVERLEDWRGKLVLGRSLMLHKWRFRRRSSTGRKQRH